MYLAQNEAGSQGDDLYSVEKAIANRSVYLTDYAFNGEKCNWRYDDDTGKNGAPAPNAYYQDTAQIIALKSSLTGTPAAPLIFMRNSCDESGGAIANNGFLEMGEATALAVQKTATSATEETFRFAVSLTREGRGMPGSFVYTNSASAAPGRITLDENGSGVLALKAGQTLTLLDLPAGARFTITETDIPAGWQLLSAANASGVIQANAASAPQLTAAFVNGVQVDLPETGDSARIALWAAFAAVASAGLITLFLLKKRACR